ncbi:MAG: hypothetical protein RJB38_1304 [Pseudomonadota bacterium]|jgi:tetratricopeptide (TPR) repeat protein
MKDQTSFKMRLLLTLTLSMALLTSACTSAQLQIESDPPGAEIYLVTADGKQKIASTPATLSPDQFPLVFRPDSKVQVGKDGYHTESFLIPPGTSLGYSRISAKLRVDSVSKTCQNSTQGLTEATDAVGQIQRMIYRKSYAEAEQALNTYIVKYPAVPAFFSMQGTVYYLQKNLDRALEAYERAQKLQPNNTETARMVEKIRAMRAPFGSNAAGGGN